MIYPGKRAQDCGSLTYTSAPVTELNGRRRTKSGDTLGQGEVASESQAHGSVRANEHNESLFWDTLDRPLRRVTSIPNSPFIFP